MAGKFFLYKYEVGDIVTFRKPHPCGSCEWRVMAVGNEVKVKCMGCERIQELSRDKIEKATKAVKR
ncbi:hypothetical protein SAMN02910456_01064 [Ruminococcaceae bacterium YRB3002]|nr:hypothetical protein SAMN02910456_01064 [Ruminococcaceae bacterium YRB3002]